MFRSLKALFEDSLARVTTPASTVDALSLAVAALLLEIARADNAIDAAEKTAVIAAVRRICPLDDASVDTLLASAGVAVEDSVSLVDFTDLLNERMARAQKLELLELLWRVAHADGRVDHYEEYYIRKLADLLHLSHGEFIRAKLAAGSAIVDRN